jgi:general L-amino acid transport system substrate-binding protein
MMRTFRGGLLIGLAVAVLVAIAAIVYEFYDTRTLKRTVRRGEVLCGVNAGLPGFSIPTTRATGPASTSTSAARWPPPSSTIRRSEVRSARRQRALHRAAEAQGRHPLAQLHLEHGARDHYDLYFPAVAYYDGQGFMLPARARSTPR